MQFKVPVIIGGAKRLNDRFKFQFFMQDIIWPKDWENQDDPMRYITQRYSTALENVIRTEPSQYLGRTEDGKPGRRERRRSRMIDL
jgi:KDO2-lipid IV(A) lauroyltransferase